MINSKKGQWGMIITIVFVIVLVYFGFTIIKDYIGKGGTESNNMIVSLLKDVLKSNDDYQISTCNPAEAVNVQVLEPKLDNQDDFFINLASWVPRDVTVKDSFKLKFSEPMDVMMIGALSDVRICGLQCFDDEKTWDEVFYNKILDCKTDNGKSRGYTEINCKITDKSNNYAIIITFPDGVVAGNKKVCKSQQKIGFKI